MGVPRSVLLGRVVLPGEPEWTREDTEAAFAYLREEALTCPGCGNPRDETMERESEGQYHSRALVCHACAVRDRKQREFTSGPHDASGLYFTAEPNE